MKCNATGLLRHHFWGDYCASLCLQFDNARQAAAVAKCNALDGTWGRWALSTTNPECMTICVDSAELDQLVEVLAKCGADPAKITSLAKSVDHGEVFELTVDAVDPNQTCFDWAC